MREREGASQLGSHAFTELRRQAEGGDETYIHQYKWKMENGKWKMENGLERGVNKFFIKSYWSISILYGSQMNC